MSSHLSCRKVLRDLPALGAGELSAPRELAVGEHLAQCASCRQALDDLRRVTEAVLALDPPEPGDLFFAALARRTLDEAVRAPAQEEGAGRARPLARRALVATVALAAAAAIAVGLHLHHAGRPTGRSAVATGAPIAVTKAPSGPARNASPSPLQSSLPADDGDLLPIEGADDDEGDDPIADCASLDAAEQSRLGRDLDQLIARLHRRSAG